VTDTPWEVEAKKASLLAATWDAPAPSMPPSVMEAEQFFQEEPAAVTEEPSAEVNEFVEQSSFHGASEFSQEQHAEAPAESAESLDSKSREGSYELPALDFSAPEAVTESPYAASAPAEVNEAKEVPAYREADFVSHQETPATAEEPSYVTETAEEVVREVAPEPEPAPAAAEVQQPDMDALVARVVAKMSPEVLQRVTQEILKPVIEALIKDELAAKK